MGAKPRARTLKPALSPEEREDQLVSLAHDLAERQLRDGTAAATVTTHFLKLGSTRERLEQERLHRENLLLSAKVEAIQSGQRIEELYKNAIDVMLQYSGRMAGDDYDDEGD